MKRGYKPSYNDRKKLEASGYDPQKYLISKKQGNKWLLLHEETGRTREAYIS